ncbi:MAG: oleate hydratase [Pilosibacter sp.]
MGSGLASLAAACFLVRDAQNAGRKHPHFRGDGHCRRCLRRD